MTIELEFLTQELERHLRVPQLTSRRNALDALIMTILSQNTNDKNRDVAFRRLKEKFPRWEMALKAGAKEIEGAIKSGGLSNQKAQRIHQILCWLKEKYGELSLDFICSIPADEAMDTLLSLKGVGVKTASVVLLFACGHQLFPIDTHIYRVLKRLSIIPLKTTAEKAFYLLADKIPQGKALSLHLNLIKFGRTICQARKPECSQCFLREQCSFYASQKKKKICFPNCPLNAI